MPTGESSSRVSATPLRRRMGILERASRSFTTADSSTRNGDAEDSGDEMLPLPSPPTSFEYAYNDDEEEAEEEGEEQEHIDVSVEEEGVAGAPAPFLQEQGPEDRHEDEGGESEHQARAWYQPSLPVLLALAPPIGNWLTGGDHLKDLLLLLLLVFYLHQLVEVPWSLYHAARPRSPPRNAAPPTSDPDLTNATVSRERARSELRALELLLLCLCLAAPLLGVWLLRSLASFTSSSAPGAPPTPISWFSSTLFGLLTALRPLRELVARVAGRTSTLHTRVHAVPPPTPRKSPSGAQTGNGTADHADADPTAQLASLRAHLTHLEALLVERDAYVGELERDVRRIERRVGKLRAARKEQKEQVMLLGMAHVDEQGAIEGSSKTIFVPAPARGRPALLEWLVGASASAANSVVTPAAIVVPPAKMHRERQRSLDSIPEEGEFDERERERERGNVRSQRSGSGSGSGSGKATSVRASSSSSSAHHQQTKYAYATHYQAQPRVHSQTYPHAHAQILHPDADAATLVLRMLREWAAAGVRVLVMLVLWPVWVALWPVRGVRWVGRRL
ncbi:hypothetical protein C8R43DRAFT_700678 [Mycena crocata]|nr:hypothetical protein C8R43DRAFT_700678 [Mycena crocata]